MSKARSLAVIVCIAALPLAHAELSFETASNLGAGIADNAYNGCLPSMTCVNVPVSGTGGYSLAGLSVTAWVDHTWIGDLVFKLVSPQSTVVTLMSRPGFVDGIDDGTGGYGDSSDLVSTHPIQFASNGALDAEWMGFLIEDWQAVCRDDGYCSYVPNSGSAAAGNLQTFVGETALGTWKFCAGDSGLGDTGAIQKVRLTFADATPALLVIAPQAIDFGGVVHDTTSAVRFVVLANDGTMELTIDSLTTALTPFQRTTDGSCGNSLPLVIPGHDSCTLSYAFAPTTQDFASQAFTVHSDAPGDTGFSLQGSGDAIFVSAFEP